MCSAPGPAEKGVSTPWLESLRKGVSDSLNEERRGKGRGRERSWEGRGNTWRKLCWVWQPAHSDPKEKEPKEEMSRSLWPPSSCSSEEAPHWPTPSRRPEGPEWVCRGKGKTCSMHCKSSVIGHITYDITPSVLPGFSVAYRAKPKLFDIPGVSYSAEYSPYQDALKSL